MTYDFNIDATDFIYASIEEVAFTLLITFILVVIVCYVFLQDWRATLVPAATIPVSLLGTFAVMLAMGYSINMFTLFALVLAIGLVVDDAICVVERVIYLMNKENHGKVWFMDPTDMPTAGWGLSLSAYEMAQIGLFVLNNGMYNNKRIISKEYIDEMSKSYVSLDYKFGNQDYGYLCWFRIEIVMLLPQ